MFNKYSSDWLFIVKSYLRDYQCKHKECGEYDHNILVMLLEQWIKTHLYKNHYPNLLWFALRELLLKKFEDVPKFCDVVDSVLMNRNEFMNAWQDYDVVDRDFSVDDIKDMIISNKYDFHKAVYDVIDVARELLEIYRRFDEDNHIDFGDDWPFNISGNIFSMSVYNDCEKNYENRKYKHTSEQLKDLRMYLQKCIKENTVCDTDVNEYRIELSDYIRSYLINVRSNNFTALCYTMWYTTRLLFMNAEKGVVYKHRITDLNLIVNIYHIDLHKCDKCNIKDLNYKSDRVDCDAMYEHIYHNIMFIQQRLSDDVCKFGRNSILEYLGNIQYVPLEL